jgi:hypothetical protein
MGDNFDGAVLAWCGVVQCDEDEMGICEIDERFT